MIKSKLHELLIEHNMSQKELSIKTGVRPQTVSNIVRNKIRQIPVDAVDSFCKIFNCDIGDIFEFIDEDKNEQ